MNEPKRLRIVELKSYGLVASLLPVTGSMYEVQVTKGTTEGEVVHVKPIVLEYGGNKGAKRVFAQYINERYPATDYQVTNRGYGSNRR